MYPEGESNPYQVFRKRLFYPLNYRDANLHHEKQFIINLNYISKRSGKDGYTSDKEFELPPFPNFWIH